MDAFLILAALLFAVILLFRVAVPTAKPEFGHGEYLSRSALNCRMDMLGKKCKVTRKGFGIAYRKYNIGRLYAELNGIRTDDGNAELWEDALEMNRTVFCDAYKKSLRSVRLLYTLGHVGKYPRLFVFCNELVKGCCGDVAENKLKFALATFEQNSPLTNREHELIWGTLAFCVFGFLSARAHNAIENKKLYLKGLSDGANEKIDLDGITDVCYACGVYDAASDKNAVIRIFETNGINFAEILSVRKRRLAEMYASVKAVERSVETIEKAEAFAEKQVIPPVENKNRFIRYVVLLVPALAVIVVAILACVYLPAEYAAVVPVFAIVLYGCFRLPLFNILPSVPIVDKIFVKLEDAVSRITERRAANYIENENSKKRLYNSETAFFGCEADRIENVFCCKNTEFICDNRGVVGFTDGMNSDVTDVIGIELTADGKRVTLVDCDGAHDDRKTVYRCFDTGFEFSAQFTSPSDSDGCSCKITVINRTSVPRSICLNCIVSCDGGSENTVSDITRTSGRTCDSRGKYVSIAGLGSAFSQDRKFCYGRVRTELKATLECVSEPFKAVTAIFSAAYGSCALESERLADHLTDDGVFDYLCDCNRSAANKLKSCEKNPLTDFCRLVRKQPDIDGILYPTPKLPTEEFAVVCGDGGYSESGEYASAIADGFSDTVFKNVLTDGRSQITTYKNKICGVVFNADDRRSDNAKRAFAAFDDIVVALSENGVLWSPLANVFDGGSYSVVFGYGHTAYFGAYNGCIVKLTCCVSSKNGLCLFDLSVENFENSSREIVVMFSAVANARSDGITVLSSETVSESADFKEAYFVRGKIDRACNFRRGGSLRAPSAAVKMPLPAYGKNRVIFAVAQANVDPSELLNADFFDKELAVARWSFGESGRVEMRSSDNVLNVLYKRARSAALTFAFTQLKNEPRFFGAACACLKYTNTNAVEKFLLAALQTQKSRGVFDNGVMAGLGTVYAVCDYTEYIGRDDFLYKPVRYAPHFSGGAAVTETGNVLEHCLRAVRHFPCDGKRNDSAGRVLYCKTLLRVLDFLKKNTKGEIVKKLDKAYQTVLKNYAEAVDFFKHTETPVFFDGVLKPAVFASAGYCCGNYEKAYAALKQGLKNFKTCSDGAGATVLYYVITEQLLGIKFKGKTVKINPRTVSACPHIEFDLISDNGKSVRIVVDESRSDGEWRMRVNKVNYASDSVGLSDKCAERVVFYRAGK